MSRDVVILGGTFDPFTLGHRAVVEQLQGAIHAELFIVPANIPPLRPPAQASFDDRLKMCRAGILGLEDVDVLELERNRAEPSYTINTMTALSQHLPDAALWIALGADAARHIAKWHRAQDLLATYNFILFNRMQEGSSEAVNIADFPPERTKVLTIDSPDVSATLVRAKVREGGAYLPLVTREVAEIIGSRHLYETADKMPQSGPAHV